MAEESPKEADKEESIEIPVGKYLGNLRKNPWMISTVVLGIAIIVLAIIMSGSNGVTGNVISEQVAGEKLISFVNSQGSGNASVVSSVKEGSLYKVTVLYQGQNIPVYVTMDGKYLITQPVPLDGAAAASNSNSTGAQPPQNVPKSDKPSVDVFVMSWCPYGTQIEKGLLPVVSALKNSIDFKIRWVDYTLHGAGESDENTVQYCIEKDQNTKYLAYLQCFLNNSGTYSGTPNSGSSLACQKQVGIDTNQVNSCVAQANKDYNISTANYQAGQPYGIDTADNQKYGVQGSPTVVINGVQVDTARSPAALLSTICSAFNNAPAACSSNLSSDSPAPGFSFSSSSGADTAAAQCGV